MTAWPLLLLLSLALVPLALTLAFRRAPSLRLVVLYDGNCAMCRRWLRLLRALDWARRIEPLSLRDAAAVAARFPQLDPRELEKDMHVVDARGGVRRAFSGYRWICWRLPLLAPFASLLYLPGMRAIGDRIYRRVADRRRLDGCGPRAEACPVHGERERR